MLSTLHRFMKTVATSYNEGDHYIFNLILHRLLKKKLQPINLPSITEIIRVSFRYGIEHNKKEIIEGLLIEIKKEDREIPDIAIQVQIKYRQIIETKVKRPIGIYLSDEDLEYVENIYRTLSDMKVPFSSLPSKSRILQKAYRVGIYYYFDEIVKILYKDCKKKMFKNPKPNIVYTKAFMMKKPLEFIYTL